MDTCPKCGSGVKEGWDNLFTCGTAYYEEGPLAGKVEERPWCWKLQRDQLQEKVLFLEDQLRIYKMSAQEADWWSLQGKQP